MEEGVGFIDKHDPVIGANEGTDESGKRLHAVTELGNISGSRVVFPGAVIKGLFLLVVLGRPSSYADSEMAKIRGINDEEQAECFVNDSPDALACFVILEQRCQMVGRGSLEVAGWSLFG